MDSKTIGQATLSQLPEIFSSIDQDKPVVLVLIRTDTSGNPTNNHQVLATGYNNDKAPDQYTLYLYDPNQPKQESVMTVQSQKDGSISITEAGVIEPTRGFFASPYFYHPSEG